MNHHQKIGIKNFFKKPKNMLISGLTVIVAIGIIISIYFLFIYSSMCGDELCFSKKLVKCDRAHYIESSAETVKQYNILGKKDNKCQVEVEILQIRQGSVELASLEGKSMICSMGLGVSADPESNIKFCHGILKEEIQEAIIQRMHSQIIENIGQIEEELIKVI